MAGLIAPLLRDTERLSAVAAAAGLALDGDCHPTVEPLGGELTNMTTEDLARIRLATGSVVVKIARSPRHSAMWHHIPAEYHAQTMAEIPWRQEADLYVSRVGSLLPPGLRMPTLFAVDELGDDRIALWMEDIVERDGDWSGRDYATAARALGRLAGRLPADAVPGDIPVRRRDFRPYFFGRVLQGALPLLRDDGTWAHPLLDRVVGDGLRGDLNALAASAPALLDRVDTLPRTLAHGDACPQNLLRPADEPDTVVAIDWTFAGVCPLGMDAGQLLAGRAESGELDPALLPALLEHILDAYRAGLADEGADYSAADVRCGVVANLVVRSAFTALPIELLDTEPNDALHTLFARRAAYARFLVDLGLAL